MVLSGCGFHLRGHEALTLPPELQTLRLTMRNAGAHPPLLTEIRHALQAHGTVRITEDVSAAVPVLNIEKESTQREVLAYDSLGRVSAYNLNYRVNFSLTGVDGMPLLSHQSVRLQRDYTFDRLQVLASEKQSEFVQTEMRRDIAQQILRRLARVKVPAAAQVPADAAQP
jgi:LPS-assembly lipoprotein